MNGCELFTTREPEIPTGGGSGAWEFPAEPLVVLSNLSGAVGRRSSVDYMKTFTLEENGMEPMEFAADPTAAASHPGIFDDWGEVQERTFAGALFSVSNLPLDSIAELTMENETIQTDLHSAYVGAGYTLKLGHVRATAPRRIAGRLEFDMLRSEDGGWYVRRWMDLRTGSDPCWSDLKAVF